MGLGIKGIEDRMLRNHGTRRYTARCFGSLHKGRYQDEQTMTFLLRLL